LTRGTSLLLGLIGTAMATQLGRIGYRARLTPFQTCCAALSSLF
jgi:hypothetical protein